MTSAILSLTILTLATIGMFRVLVVSGRIIARTARTIVPRSSTSRVRARVLQLKAANEQRSSAGGVL